jgi:hypothetical protein
MGFNKQHIYLLVTCAALCGCTDRASVRLSLDFSKQSAWRYTLDAVVNGSIASQDTQRTFTSAAHCTLNGTADPSDPKLLHAAVSSVSISSNILGEAEVQNLTEQAKGVRLTCALNDGLIIPEDSSALPLVRIGEWDLFKDLAKTVPALPKIKVRVGSAWDREKTIPLETKYGSATGHLLQSFSLDSLYTNNRSMSLALLRWKFSYQVEFKNLDTAGLPGSMPSKGSGTGNAVINVTEKTLEHASVNFVVPAPDKGEFRISWREDIELKLVK